MCFVLLDKGVEGLPCQEATNKLATALAKAKKQVSASPLTIHLFPHPEVADFVPNCIGASRILPQTWNTLGS